MEVAPLRDPLASDAAWSSQVQHWQTLAEQLKAQLVHTERTCEERLRHVQQRCEHDARLHEATNKEAGAQFLSSAKQEVERLSRTSADAAERARQGDERVMMLLTESQEAANLMALVTVKFERQVDISAALKRKLKQSEVETENLRFDLQSAEQREAEKSKQYVCAESTIASILPRLTEEAKVEARAAEDAQES